MDDIKNKRPISTYFPWIALIVLTIVLMVVFKMTDQGYDTLKTHGENLLAKYTKGLQPLYSNTEITNEDVFNFALYDKIPLDKKKKKILNLETDTYGNEKIQIMEIDSEFDTENYSSFKQKLKLKSDEEVIVDSLIDSYKNDIYATILQNDENNVVAVAPELSFLHKALSADIYSFAIKKMRESEGSKVASLGKAETANRFVKQLNNARVKAPSEYFILTPDTAFSSRAFSTSDASEKESSFAEKINPKTNQIADDGSVVAIEDFDKFYELSPIPESEFHYTSDSSLKKLVVPSNLIASSFKIAYDSLQYKLDVLTEEFEKMNMTFTGDENSFNFSVKTMNENVADEINLEFDFGNLGSFIGNTVEMALSAKSEKDWEKFGHKMDSLSRVISDYENDSAAIIKLKMLSEELKKRKLDEVTKNKKPSQKNNN